MRVFLQQNMNSTDYPHGETIHVNRCRPRPTLGFFSCVQHIQHTCLTNKSTNNRTNRLMNIKQQDSKLDDSIPGIKVLVWFR